MINRVLIRIKVVQIIYSYYLNTKKDLLVVEKELFFSMEKSFELYHLLLLLMVSITEMQDRKLDAAKHKLLPSEADLNPNTKFIDNKFIAQLSKNKQLNRYLSDKKKSWANHSDLVKNLLEEIISTDIYAAYMVSSERSYEADREFWRKIFKSVICNNEELLDTLEDMSVYWNDDIDIICTFVLKTIKRFEEKTGEEQDLLPMFKANEDREFAKELLSRTIIYQTEYEDMIRAQAKNWEFERIALMDLIIMQTALSELTGFSTIPLNVTLNEYIEIAKHYSTEKSGNFINGILDGIIFSLKKENKLSKD